MKIIEDIKLDFKDVLIVPNRTTLESRSQVELTRIFEFYHSPKRISVIPVCAANMASIAGVNMALTLEKSHLITILHKYLSNEEIHKACGIPWNFVSTLGIASPYVFMSIGMKESDIDKLQNFYQEYNYYPNICIDVPNGYCEKFVKFCYRVRNIVNDSIIMAGNVITPEMTQELIIHGGVDIVKIGIGPGSNCQTRKITGVSYPQISAAIECSSVAHGLKSGPKKLGLICLDGGFKEIGDLAKGFVAGADFCMTGNLFAGTDECCGEWIEVDGTKYLVHYGMSSHYAQEKHEGSQKTYRASEGIVTHIEHKGKVGNVVQEILGGLRSTGTYIGADCLKDFNKCGNFIKVYS